MLFKIRSNSRLYDGSVEMVGHLVAFTKSLTPTEFIQVKAPCT